MSSRHLLMAAQSSSETHKHQDIFMGTQKSAEKVNRRKRDKSLLRLSFSSRNTLLQYSTTSKIADYCNVQTRNTIFLQVWRWIKSRGENEIINSEKYLGHDG